MKLGKIKILLIIISLILFSSLYAEDKIISAPIINLENLEPSYEIIENEKDNIPSSNTTIRKRKTINKDKNNFKFVNLIGLDKITAKTIPIKNKIRRNCKIWYFRN